jgi:hypothetical protein
MQLITYIMTLNNKVRDKMKVDIWEKVETVSADNMDTNRHIFCEQDEDQSQYRVLKVLKDGTAIDVSSEGNWVFQKYLDSKI